MSTSTTREAWQQPFAVDSIWNMPIHVDAVYVDAQIPTDPTNYSHMSPDENISIGAPDAPKRDVHDTDVLFSMGGGTQISGADRCGGWEAGTINAAQVPIPESFTTVGSPLRNRIGGNNSTAIYQDDLRTIHQVNPFESCGDSPRTYVSGNGNPINVVQIDGDGRLGGHAGSGLSSIGGTLRLRDLEPGTTIAHALQMNPWAVSTLYFDQTPGGDEGFRWPARRDDGYANDPATGRHYQGLVPEVRMGALMALLPTFDETTLETELAQRIARALKDYGGYFVDDASRNVVSVNMCWEQRQDGAAQTATQRFLELHGYEVDENDPAHPWVIDMKTIWGSLHVVDSNDEFNIGGGPTGDPETKRRAPFAKPLRFGPYGHGAGLGLIGIGSDAAHDGYTLGHEIVGGKPLGLPDRELQRCTDRLLGYLWGDGNDNGGGAFFWRSLSNVIADEFERCANMVLGAANVNRGFNTTNNFHTFNIQWDGLAGWPDGLPGYVLDVPAFAASVIEGEGQGDDTAADAGRIYDGPNANRRQAFADLVARENVITTINGQNVISDPASWPIFQTWPFVAFGRVPGA